jgi:hypothetical protein
MISEETKEKLMPILRHFGFVIGAAVVGIVIQTGNDYLVPALQASFPDSKVFVPAITTGVGFLAGLYAKSPLTKKGAA